MKLSFLRTAAALAAIPALLVGCGGGGDDNAGSLTELSIVPSEFTAVGAPDSCGTVGGAVGAQTTVFVYGGAAPYRLDNTSPLRVGLNKTRVENRGDSFVATFLGGCVDPATVVVVDANDRQVTLTLINTDEQN